MVEMSLGEKQALVEETRQTFGAAAAREMWRHLGLPEVAAMTEPPSGAQLTNPMRGLQHDWPKFITRIPPVYKAWLAQQAGQNGSSINSEVLRCVRERMESEAATSVSAKATTGRASES